MVLTALLYYVLLAVLSDLLRPKPDVENVKKAKLTDFQFPTATEGRPVPIVFGTVKLSGPNVVWYGDLKQVPITNEVGGGLFTSGEDVIVGYKYKIGIQFGLCRGEIDSISTIWIGDKMIYAPVGEGNHKKTIEGAVLGAGTVTLKRKTFFGGDELGNGGINGDLTIFVGTESQAPSTYLADFQAEGGDTPGYRGTCYAVFEQGYIGNSTQIEPWAFEVRRIPVGLGATNSVVNVDDANPAHVLYEAITNSEWGLDESASDIDVASFEAAAATLESEDNGFSYAINSTTEAEEFIGIVEEQIDGKVILDLSTGKWKLVLARNDYVINDLPEVTNANLIAVESFSRGTWEDSTNQITVNFTDRQLEYKETYAVAQDMANQRIQGRVVFGTKTFPGVTSAALANNLAWRQLRQSSFPLARVVLRVDRSLFGLQVLSVIKWSSTVGDTAFTDLVLRVTKVDYGNLDQGQIRVEAVQDIFAFAEASYADPFGTGWVTTDDDLVAVPANEQVVMEAPYAFLVRDPDNETTVFTDKLWCGFRPQVQEAKAFIVQRNSSGTPSGDFEAAGSIFAVMQIGTLAAALDTSGAGLASFSLNEAGTLGSQSDVIDGMDAEPAASVMGLGLINLIMIGEADSATMELCFVGGVAEGTGSQVDFTSVYRGVLDSTRQAHSLGDRVYLLCMGGALSAGSIPADNNVDVKLVVESSTETLAEATATTVAVDFDNRLRRPYAPSRLELNGSEYPSGNVSLDVALQGAPTSDQLGLTVEYVRRDFRTLDEVAGWTDESLLPSDFPAANTTEYRVELSEDPSGSNTLLLAYDWGEGSGDFNDFDFSRTDIIAANGGAVPTDLRVKVRARHTYDSVVYEAAHPLQFDFTSESDDLDGLFELGVLDDTDVSATYVAAATGTFTFTIGTDLFTTDDVEARLNGGSWTTVIASGGGVSGTLAVTSGDDLEVRHLQSGAGSSQTQLVITNPSATSVAQGILVV